MTRFIRKLLSALLIAVSFGSAALAQDILFDREDILVPDLTGVSDSTLAVSTLELEGLLRIETTSEIIDPLIAELVEIARQGYPAELASAAKKAIVMDSLDQLLISAAPIAVCTWTGKYVFRGTTGPKYTNGQFMDIGFPFKSTCPKSTTLDDGSTPWAYVGKCACR